MAAAKKFLLLKGVFHDEHDTYPQGTWITR
jgi:hypothetical protein